MRWGVWLVSAAAGTGKSERRMGAHLGELGRGAEAGEALGGEDLERAACALCKDGHLSYVVYVAVDVEDAVPQPEPPLALDGDVLREYRTCKTVPGRAG